MNKQIKYGLKYASLVLTLTMIGACSSDGVKVLERSDDLSSRPDWASTTKSTFKKDGNIFYVGFVTTDGASSPSAAMNMSDEKALSSPMAAMSDQFLDQNQVGENLRESTGSRVISSLRSQRVPMPSLQITKRYWERVRMQDGEGIIKVELRVYSLAEVSDQDFAKARQIAFDRLQGTPEIKSILSDVGRQQRERALSSEKPKTESQ